MNVFHTTHSFTSLLLNYYYHVFLYLQLYVLLVSYILHASTVYSFKLNIYCFCSTECDILWIFEFLEHCMVAVHRANTAVSMVAGDAGSGADHDHFSVSFCGTGLMVAD